MKHFAVLFLLALAGCAHTSEPSAPLPMPSQFANPRYLIEFLSDLQSEVIQRRINQSHCGQASDDMSSLALFAGTSTRPSTTTSLYIEAGEHLDGSKWYVMKAKDKPELPLCGVRLVAQGTGTEVSVYGLRRKNMEPIALAVDSGKLFCECAKLSK